MTTATVSTPSAVGVIEQVMSFLKRLQNPLAADLEALGITTLPPDLVRRHMWATYKKEGVPMWYALPNIVFGELVLFLPTVVFLLSLGVGFLPLTLVVKYFGAVALAKGLANACVLMMTPFLVLALVIIMIGVSEFFTASQHRKHWVFLYVLPRKRGDLYGVPPHVVERIRRADRALGDEVAFERAVFARDPIIFAKVLHAPSGRMLRVPIGAYDTGTELDEM